MTTYVVKPSELEKLRGKTILITGCASGIGRATAQIAYANGANLVLADFDEELSKSLTSEFVESRFVFRKTNVAQWDDVLEVFQLGWTTFGIINAAISNAGINSGEGLLEDKIDPVTGRLMAPSLDSVNVNLIAHAYVAKCAQHYFAKWPETRCQIVLTGSAASFIDTPPLYMYCAAKAGVLGLMRGLRSQLIKENITINVIAPWMTVTPMLLPEFLNIWGTLPANQPEGVAHALLMPIIRPDVNGKSFFVAGHEIVDFEDSLHSTQPQWMGEQLSRDVDEGQRRLIP